MRLDVFHPGFSTFGGAEVLLLAQARGLRAMGFEPRISTFDLEGERWAELLEGLPVSLIPKRALSDLLFGWGKLGKAKARFRRFKAALGESPLLLAHNFPANAMAGRLGGSTRTVWYGHEPPRSIHPVEGSPLLHAMHLSGEIPGELRAAVEGHRDRLARQDRALAAWEKEGVAGLSALVANSGFTASTMKAIYGRCDAVIPPLVPVPKGARAPWGGGAGGLKVMTQARLDHMKNVGTVIRGFAAHARRHGGATLHVVGEGRDRDRLESLGRELGVGDRITFHGHLSQTALEALRAEMQAFALLPVDEPFGMVFVEAALAGLLVVGPNQGGPLDILEGGALGAVADPRDPDSLVQALDRFAALSDAEAEALRQRASDACRARYAPEVILPALAAILRG